MDVDGANAVRRSMNLVAERGEVDEVEVRASGCHKQLERAGRTVGAALRAGGQCRSSPRPPGEP